MTGKRHRKRTPGRRDREIGQRVVHYRNLRGMSQADLAHHVGVSWQQMRKYELGENGIAAVRLEEIAKILEVPIQRFFEKEKS